MLPPISSQAFARILNTVLYASHLAFRVYTYSIAGPSHQSAALSHAVLWGLRQPDTHTTTVVFHDVAHASFASSEDLLRRLHLC